MKQQDMRLKEEFDNILNLKLEEHRQQVLKMDKDEIYEASVETFLLEAIVRGLQFLVSEPTIDDIGFLESGWVEYILELEMEEFPDLDPGYLEDVYFECFEQYIIEE